MRAHEREQAALVYLGYIFNYPGFRCMAPFTFKSNGLVMHIDMALHAFSLGLIKNE
jgi:hypothetical protein